MRAILLVALAVALGAAAEPAIDWDPRAFAGEDTLELRTVDPKGGERWFKVWLVVLDGEVYVRLGTRAADRVRASTTAPYVGVRVAGREVDRVRGVPAPAEAARVARAMADKYWSDVLIRHFAHPLTLRLVPEPTPVAAQPR